MHLIDYVWPLTNTLDNGLLKDPLSIVLCIPQLMVLFPLNCTVFLHSHWSTFCFWYFWGPHLSSLISYFWEAQDPMWCGRLNPFSRSMLPVLFSLGLEGHFVYEGLYFYLIVESCSLRYDCLGSSAWLSCWVFCQSSGCTLVFRDHTLSLTQDIKKVCLSWIFWIC